MNSIIDTVKAEVFDFLHNSIEVVPGYDFETYETIKRIHLYENSQFEDGSEYNGVEPLFFNIINYRRDNVARFLDFDTADIQLEELNPRSTLATMLLNYKMRRYLKEQNYTEKINRMANYLATYGSLVLEKRKDRDEIVDLRRLFYDPTVNNLQDSRFVTMKMYFTEQELRDTAKKNGWDEDKVEKIIRKKRSKKSQAPQSYEDEGSSNEIRSANYFEVYKRWGMLPRHMIDGGKSEDQINTFTVVVEPEMVNYNKQNEPVPQGEVLFKGRWNKENYPFEECHLIKVQGRWLGVGIFELLFPMQERFNEVMNQRRVSMELSSMHLFQSADNLLYNNLLNDLENGDVIQSKNGLQPVVNEERNLQAFQVEEESYTRNADALSFRNDIISGEVPASMPATNALLSQNNVQAVHLIKRQNFANFVRRFITHNVVPELTNSIDSSTVMKFVGESDDLFVLDDLITRKAVRNELVNRAMEGEPVVQPQVEEIQNQVRKDLQSMGAKRFLRFADSYFDDKEMDIDINIDSEQRDVEKIVQNTFSFMQAFAQNPQSLSDPVMREFALSVGRDIGMDVGKLEMAFAQRDAQGGQQQQGEQNVERAAEQVQPLQNQPTTEANQQQ